MDYKYLMTWVTFSLVYSEFPELKYDNSIPIALIGFARLESSETRPRPNSIFRIGLPRAKKYPENS